MRFKKSGTNQYAEIVVNGKTGKRSIPLFAAVPYVKDWIDNHPQGNNPKVYLIPSLDKEHGKFGNRMKEESLNAIYRKYKVDIFPKFLDDPKVVPEDKKKIKDLILKKPWNPYIFRHSALTAKSTVLKEHTLRQHAGWTVKSMMHMRYLHYFGNESNERLLAEYGIVTEANKGNVLLPDSLRPIQCPNCFAPNIPTAKFCANDTCRMVLRYDAYEETIAEQKKKDDMLEQMRREQLEFQQRYQREREEQIRAQERNQELLEVLWLHQQQQQQEQEQKQQQHPIKNAVDRHIIYRRNEVGVPPTPWMQTFVLNDPRKSDEENNKNITNSMFDNKNNLEVSWRRLPGITKEQEEKWHNSLVEGLKKEKEEEQKNRSKKKGKKSN